eukprot:472513-Hanusia_phi.AAC.4
MLRVERPRPLARHQLDSPPPPCPSPAAPQAPGSRSEGYRSRCTAASILEQRRTREGPYQGDR